MTSRRWWMRIAALAALALLVGVGALLTFIAVSMLSPLVAAPAARVLTAPATRTHAITGILARILEKHPSLTVFQAKTILRALAANVRGAAP